MYGCNALWRVKHRDSLDAKRQPVHLKMKKTSAELVSEHMESENEVKPVISYDFDIDFWLLYVLISYDFDIDFWLLYVFIL